MVSICYNNLLKSILLHPVMAAQNRIHSPHPFGMSQTCDTSRQQKKYSQNQHQDTRTHKQSPVSTCHPKPQDITMECQRNTPQVTRSKKLHSQPKSTARYNMYSRNPSYSRNKFKITKLYS
jgi:hypothetical protein